MKPRGRDWSGTFGPGLYLHVPFCRARCGYCDFYRTVDLSGKAAWLDRMVREIEAVAAVGVLDGRACRTLYLGGGTPSLLEGAELARLLAALRAGFAFDPGLEATIEANPESVDPARAEAWRAAGINRLSLGVQSFHDDELRRLGRLHDAGQARAAWRAARSAGFENLSLDLIYALPGSTAVRWGETLAQALDLGPEHLSAYCLTLEGDVPMERAWRAGEISLPADDDARVQYEMLVARAAGAGLAAYEISNFARPGMACRHNRNYWTRGDYLGFGPSAHSHLAGRRWWNAASLPEWSRAIDEGELPEAGHEEVDPAAAAAEWIFLGLRQAEGIPWTVLEGACPERATQVRAQVDRLVGQGYLEWDDGAPRWSDEAPEPERPPDAAGAGRAGGARARGTGYRRVETGRREARAGIVAAPAIPWLRLTPEARFVSNAVFRELLSALD